MPPRGSGGSSRTHRAERASAYRAVRLDRHRRAAYSLSPNTMRSYCKTTMRERACQTLCGSPWCVLFGLTIWAFVLSPVACVEAPRGGRATTMPAAEAKWEVPPELRDTFAGGLIGSKHDFSRDPRNPRDLCLTCHTPHMTTKRAPLLDRDPRSAQPASLRQAFGDELNSSSILCLSCHDGVTAPDVYTSSHSLMWTGQLGSQQYGSRPLTSHPIGAKYPVVDAKYHSPAEVESDGRMRLPGGRVQCTSCHDPHNTERHPAMLVRSNQRSSLCLACHRL